MTNTQAAGTPVICLCPASCPATSMKPSWIAASPLVWESDLWPMCLNSSTLSPFLKCSLVPTLFSGFKLGAVDKTLSFWELHLVGRARP